jgi:hypothetical protein
LVIVQVTDDSAVCPDCPAGWAGYKNCIQAAKEAEQAFLRISDLVGNTAKAAVRLLGLADVPLICDCGSAASEAVIDVIELARSTAEIFSVVCWIARFFELSMFSRRARHTPPPQVFVRFEIGREGGWVPDRRRFPLEVAILWNLIAFECLASL